ncbi:heat shock protein DNAJ [Angomonas deanei]|uniref:Uncharacterized protein n=1 Tax=Angomonas deanei TaxID=59799 RepID=S9VI21_9TRYP|nr:heat shock protein DNAJ [Angomonas deanei]EPY42437.1 heat shock protein DNAJ [Angomonas deanei]CAD2215385.1 hypothetical protein, conserved [Angomonas deanei]|eukprot:EPY29872.1 heat shock protein DNAJ [Angomonas deanei]
MQQQFASGSSAGPTGQSYSGYSSPYGFNHSQQYRAMSKEEADRLFREIFGGMRVDQIFRNLEEEMRRGNIRSGSGLGHNVGKSFDPSEQTFRPFFRTEQSTTKIFTDAYGNRHEEVVYSDPRGERFTVRRTVSTDPNASVNQTTEDWKNHHRGRDGRVHFGSSASRQTAGNTDFTQEYFGFRSHGRNPLIAFLFLGMWFMVIALAIYTFCYMIVFHPFLVLFLFFLSISLRRGRF